jgi:hypothetical protein
MFTLKWCDSDDADVVVVSRCSRRGVRRMGERRGRRAGRGEESITKIQAFSRSAVLLIQKGIARAVTTHPESGAMFFFCKASSFQGRLAARPRRGQPRFYPAQAQTVRGYATQAKQQAASGPRSTSCKRCWLGWTPSLNDMHAHPQEAPANRHFMPILEDFKFALD